MEAKIKQLEESNAKVTDLESKLQERESAVENYKKKIVALEFKEEDSLKKINVLTT